MRTRRFIGMMRAMAWVGALSTSGLALTAPLAQARQLAERSEAMKPKPVNELAPGLTQSLTPEQWAKVDAQRAKERAKKEASKPAVRVLSDKEMAGLHGRGPQRNKYLLGTLPWQRSLRDANLCTGNLFKSFTDIQVAPAKGAGLALQRTYNSNDDRPGPFGVGWTHAYDIRMEEAQSDPVKDYDADPTTTYMDANFTNRADFFGHKHRYHRDADGLYTPPAYLFDELDSNYNKFLTGDRIVQASVSSDDQHSMDGTVKHFDSIGNARVCSYIQDRYSNKTTLVYDTASSVSGGTIPLLKTVTDPSGRALKFYWHDFQPNPTGAGQDHVWRIVQVDGPQYSVVYSYGINASAPDSYFNLTSVTLDAAVASPYVSTGVVGGQTPRTTTFTYSNMGGESGLLASIADPQAAAANEPTGGHTVSYTYQISSSLYAAQGQTTPMPTNSVWVATITEAAGYDASRQIVIGQTWYILPFVYGNYLFVTTFGNSDLNPREGNRTLPDNFVGGTLTVDGQLRTRGMWSAIPQFGLPLIDQFYVPVYDPANNVTQMTDNGGISDVNSGSPPNRRIDHFTYGPHGNQLTHSTGDDPADTTTYYNASQYFQKKSVTDANGRTTTFIVGSNQGVDPSGHLPTSSGNKGSVLYVQDADYLTTEKPSSGRQFSYGYDTYGRKTDETDLNGVTTHYDYGGITDGTTLVNGASVAVGNLTKVTRDYDAAATRLNLQTTMAYDVVGHVLHSVDPKGNRSEFAYNNLGQPTEADFYAPAPNNAAAQETITYGYGTNGRTERVTDRRGATMLTYEQGGDRVLSVSDPTSNTSVSYTYAPTGERTRLQLPGQQGQWTYHYGFTGDSSSGASVLGGNGDRLFSKDDPNSLAHVLTAIDMTDANSSNRSQRVDYKTDSLGHLRAAEFNQAYTTETTPKLVSYCQTDYSYDHASVSNVLSTHWWLTGIKNTFNTTSDNPQGAAQSILVSNTYDYHFPNGTLDYAGNRHSNALHSDATTGIPATDRTETYQYDDLYRLSNVNYGDGQTQSYGFTSMGNRATKNDNATGNETYSYDALNRLTNRAVSNNGATSSQNYTFDTDGNTLTDGVRSNVWDAQNRLSQCSTTLNGVTTFTYGADGLRRQKSNVLAGVTTVTDSLLDNGMLVQERNHTTGSSLATYMVGLRGPECRRDDTGGGGLMRWYLYDGLGSVLGEVAPTGAVVSSRKLDVYGLARSTSVAAGEKPSKQAFVGSLGHTTDAETGGLVYMRARYMDSTTGRFISEDPARHGENWFAYCNNNSINHVDADGKAPDDGDTPSDYEKFLGRMAIFAICIFLAVVIGNMIGSPIARATVLQAIMLGIAASAQAIYGDTLMGRFRSFLSGLKKGEKIAIADEALLEVAKEGAEIEGELATQAIEGATDTGQLTLPFE